MILSKPKIIFLSYINRSGSTYLSAKLNSHKDIVVTPEASFPQSLLGYASNEIYLSTDDLKPYIRHLFDDYKFASWKLNKEELLSLASKQWPDRAQASSLMPIILSLYVEQINLEAKVVIFKEGARSVLDSNRFFDHFPEAGLIHMIRDPRAVFHSQRKSKGSVDGLPMAISPKEFAQNWNLVMESSRNLKAKAVEYRELRYEDLIQETNNAWDEILQWIGLTDLEIPTDVAAYNIAIPDRQKHLHDRLSGKPDASRIDSWRDQLAAEEVAIIEFYCSGEMREHQYEPLSSLNTPSNKEFSTAPTKRIKVMAVVSKLWKYAKMILKPALMLRTVNARLKGW